MSPGIVTYTYTLRTSETEAGGSGIHHSHTLPSKFDASLRHMR